MFKPGVQRKGLTERRRRRIRHDERCRGVLEKVAKNPRSSYTMAVRELERANIRAPRGGVRWNTGQAWRIARRLGLDLNNGRGFGELPRCVTCDAHTGWRSERGQCRQCNKLEHHRHQMAAQDSQRKGRIWEVERRLQELRAELKDLKEGRRHYPKRHSRPTRRFGKPITYRLGGEERKRSGG